MVHFWFELLVNLAVSPLLGGEVEGEEEDRAIKLHAIMLAAKEPEVAVASTE